MKTRREAKIFLLGNRWRRCNIVGLVKPYPPKNPEAKKHKQSRNVIISKSQNPISSWNFLVIFRAKKQQDSDILFLTKKQKSKLPWTKKTKTTQQTHTHTKQKQTPNFFQPRQVFFTNTLDAFPSITKCIREGTGFNLGCAIQTRASWICGGLEFLKRGFSVKNIKNRGFRYVFVWLFFKGEKPTPKKNNTCWWWVMNKFGKASFLCIGCTQNGFETRNYRLSSKRWP